VTRASRRTRSISTERLQEWDTPREAWHAGTPNGSPHLLCRSHAGTG
jgi:hypothetical protein